MLKVLRKISGHSNDGDHEKNVPPRRKDVNKDLRKPYNAKTAQYPPQVTGTTPVPDGKQHPFAPSKPATTLSSTQLNESRSVSSGMSSGADSTAHMTPHEIHESLIRQNQINRKKSEQYYIYDFDNYRGPTNESVSADPNYNIFNVRDGINASSARYVVHYLTKEFKRQLMERLSTKNSGLDTDVLRASMEIFKPNLSHFSNSEINICKRILRSFFPWKGCSLTGTAIENTISENYGDFSNLKHWTRLILSLRIIWSQLSNGIIPWKSYQNFCKLELQKNYPIMSFYNLLPQCLPNHDYTCTAFEFLEILVAIISKVDLVVDKNVQMDLIFTAGQVCFTNDKYLQKHIQDDFKGEPDIIALGKLYTTRGNALLHLFVAYLRSLAEEGKIKDFYLVDNFHIDNYPPQPYKPVTQTALTLTVPSLEPGKNDFNTLLRLAAKSQSRIYSSNHTFSKQENAFLDKFEEDPYKVFDTIFSKSSKRYLYKFDKNFDPNALKKLSESSIQKALGSISENDQYAVATWIDHIKGQDFNDFLSVLDDSGHGEGTLAFDSSAINFGKKSNNEKENISPVRVSKMNLSEWFISSWKYETFLQKVQNTLLIKLTKRIGDCDWLVLSTDERVGKSCYLTPPSSSDSAKMFEGKKLPRSDSDDVSIKSRPPPPNLLGEKSYSPLLETSSSSIYSGISKFQNKPSPIQETSNNMHSSRKSKMSITTSGMPPVPQVLESRTDRNEIMTPVERNGNHSFQMTIPNPANIPPVMAKVNNPSMLDVRAPENKSMSGKRRSVEIPATPESRAVGDRFDSIITDQQHFAKPLDFGAKVRAVVSDILVAETTQDEISYERKTNPVETSINNSSESQKTTLSDIKEDEGGANEEATKDHDSLDMSVSLNDTLENIEKEVGSLKSLKNSKEVNEDLSHRTRIVSSNITGVSTTVNGEDISLNKETHVHTRREVRSSDITVIVERKRDSTELNAEGKDISSTDDFEDASSLKSDEVDEDEKDEEEEEMNDVHEYNNASSVATTAYSEALEKNGICGSLKSEKDVPSLVEQSGDSTDPAEKSISLTPSKKLLRASALIETESSPNDILNDLIDNYNSESLVAPNNEGATLFEVIKSQMERLSHGKDLPPVPNKGKPVLEKLKMDVLKESEDGENNEDLPLVTPTKSTTYVNGFSYNATPPMKQNEFQNTTKLPYTHDPNTNFYRTLKKSNESERKIDEPVVTSGGEEDEEMVHSLQSIQAEISSSAADNKSFRNVMLKTRRSFRNLKSKSLKT